MRAQLVCVVLLALASCSLCSDSEEEMKALEADLLTNMYTSKNTHLRDFPYPLKQSCVVVMLAVIVKCIRKVTRLLCSQICTNLTYNTSLLRNCFEETTGCVITKYSTRLTEQNFLTGKRPC
ncbi:neurotensin/neuromedin N isoform X2 [Anser cygnoides]|uniref:neurotensin/neuromedin N isoform X2 n=1 Tax=Anser cygnoides TaxID=8845 RepID=UPI0034D1F154